MKKHIFIILNLSLFTFVLQAQIYEFHENGRWGFINKQGAIVLPPVYDFIYHEIRHKHTPTGFFLIEKDGKYGIYKTGQGEIVPPDYQYIKLDASTAFITAENDSASSIFDSNGKLKAGPESGLGGHTTRDGLVVISIEGKYGAWDPSGTLEIPFEQDWINFLSSSSFILSQKDERTTLWKRDGQKLIDNFYGNLFVMSDTLIMYQPAFEGLKGLMDTTGRKITEAVFDEVKRSRREDYYWFLRDDLWGMMDKRGNTVLEPVFTQKGSWIGPLGIGEVFGKFGLFNANGNFLTEIMYDEIQLYDGTARLRENTTWTQISFTEDGDLDTRMRLIVSGKLSYDTRANAPAGTLTRGESISITSGANWFVSNGLWGLRDSNGTNVLIPPTYDYVNQLGQNDLSLVAFNDKAGNIYLQGLVDHKEGIELLKPNLTNIYTGDFQTQAVARAQLSNGVYVLVNLRGKIKTMGRIGYIGRFQNGIARANKGGWLVADYVRLGRQHIPDAQNRGGKWGFLGRDGEWKMQPAYQKVFPFHQKMALMKKEGKWGAINRRFKTVLPPLYDSLAYSNAWWDKDDDMFKEWIGDSVEVLLTFENQHKYYFLDSTGTYLFSHVLDTCNSFKEGMVRVCVGDKWGFINKQGEMVVEPRFERASDFQGGLARVRTRLRWGYINPKGEFVVKPKYYRADDFEHGLARVRTRTRYGFIDHQGNWVIKPKYRRATDFGYRVSIARKKKKYGVLNMEGKWVIRPRFSKISIQEDTFLVSRNGVKWKIPFQKKNIPVDQASRDIVHKEKIALSEIAINKNSEIKRRHQLDFLNLPSEGIQIGGFKRQIGIIHKNGTVIFPPSAERIAYKQGLFRIYKNDQIGYLTTDGKWVRDIR